MTVRQSDIDIPAKEKSPMRALLQEDLDDITRLTDTIFSRLEAPSKAGSSVAQATAAVVAGSLQSMREVEKRMRAHLQLARKHSSNQARIDELQEGLRIREERTKLMIRELSRIQSELKAIDNSTSEELRRIRKAEKNPLSFDDLISYASRLSSVTSAPPGFKLPAAIQIPSPPPEDAEEEKGEDGQDKKKPKAYYDPKMPGMPERLPFPDEGMMRRGALGAAAMGQGVVFAPIVAPGAEGADGDLGQEQPGAAQQELSEEMQEEMRRRAEEARRKQEAEEADAFDLDLN